MKLRAALAIFTRRTASIVLLLVLGVLGGAATLITATPRYDATATVLLAVRPAGTPYEALSGSVYATTRITSYAEVARSPAVLTPVILRTRARSDGRRARRARLALRSTSRA